MYHKKRTLIHYYDSLFSVKPLILLHVLLIRQTWDIRPPLIAEYRLQKAIRDSPQRNA